VQAEMEEHPAEPGGALQARPVELDERLRAHPVELAELPVLPAESESEQLAAAGTRLPERRQVAFEEAFLPGLAAHPRGAQAQSLCLVLQQAPHSEPLPVLPVARQASA
jgi:hypothetical protein